MWAFFYMMWMALTEFKITNFASDMVYTLWALLAGHLIGAMCGAVSLCASWFFVTVLYMISKSD